MALTKIGKEGITGVSNSANATFLTATSAEGVTLAGTLAVTGVHTVGENAIYDSEGGASTQNLVQGLAKLWVIHNDGTASDSYNLGSITDNGTGDFTYNFTNSFRAAGNYTISGFVSNNASQVGTHSMNTADEAAAAGSARINTGFIQNTNGGTSLLDCNNSSLILHGDLA
jgi:hypothetical protein